MSDGTDTSGVETGDPLSLTHEEMRITFEYQVRRLQEIDNKAVEILKANLLLIGILVTAGSVLFQTDFDAATLLNVFTLTGGLLLFGSTGLAGVTYTASNLRGGLDVNAVERAIASDERGSDHSFQKQLLRSYGRWIEYNAQVTAVNDLLVTATVFLVIVSFAYVVAGIAAGLASLSALLQALAFVGFTVPIAWIVWLAYHMDHLETPTQDPEDTTFAGVRLSKGATRADGLTALGRMLAGPSPPTVDIDE